MLLLPLTKKQSSKDWKQHLLKLIPDTNSHLLNNKTKTLQKLPRLRLPKKKPWQKKELKLRSKEKKLLKP
jgi:hypothetical protein